MKNFFSKDRIVTSFATIAVCGVAYAATTPFTLPWQEAVVANDHHERVVSAAGEYEGKMTMHMPGMDPMTVDCTENVSPIGSLWTTTRFEANIMGMPFVGSAILGYDTDKEKYVGTWIDNMTTTIIPMEGEYDEAKKAIVMHYEMFDAASGKVVNMRNEQVDTEDGYAMTFYIVGDEGDTLQMQMDMKRKAAAVEAGSGR